jgi:hypothetical protein
MTGLSCSDSEGVGGWIVLHGGGQPMMYTYVYIITKSLNKFIL